MDRLEEHIKNNRDDLDIYNPSPDLWKKVTKELNSGKKHSVRWLSVAASVAVIVTTSVLFYQIGRRSSNIDRSEIIDGKAISVRVQLKEAEVFYSNQINQLYSEAAPMLTANPELEHEFNSEISQIDSIYSDLRKDLKDNVANQEVVEALIQNYMKKIKILEDMLSILRENENNGEKNNGYEL